MKLPSRKTIRLENYDYSSPGVYFITLCTQNRKCILSDIVGDGVLDVPCILTHYGEIVDKYIKQMDSFYKYISIHKYTIMPNHIHLLVEIDRVCGTSGMPSPTNKILPQFVSTLKRFCNKECGEKIWQRGYNDHIIRNKTDYEKVWHYIDTNVLRWQLDELYIGKCGATAVTLDIPEK